MKLYLEQTYKLNIDQGAIRFGATFPLETVIKVNDFDFSNRTDFISLLAANQTAINELPDQLGHAKAKWPSIDDDFLQWGLNVFDDNDKNEYFYIYISRENTKRAKITRYSARISKQEYGPVAHTFEFTSKDLEQHQTLNSIKNFRADAIYYE